MDNIKIIDELKNIDIAIVKKMFAMMKVNDLKSQPSPLQLKILDYLIHNQNNQVVQKDLEENLNISKSTISGVLLTMENNNLITRTQDELDARVKIVSLTKQSKEKYEQMQLIVKKTNEMLINDISQKDLNTFLKVLEKMQNNLKEKD